MSFVKVIATGLGLIIQDSQSITITAGDQQTLVALQVSGATKDYEPFPIYPGIPVLSPPGQPPPPCNGCQWQVTYHPLNCQANTIFIHTTTGLTIDAARLNCVGVTPDCTNCTTPPSYIINPCQWGCADPTHLVWGGPADYNCDGDAGTDADIEAFWSCLAGNCCPHCTADFNQDGDSGTDADIAAFYAALGGHAS